LKKFDKAVIAFVCVLVSIMSFMFGVAYGLSKVEEPEVVTKTVTETITKEVPVYVEVEKEEKIVKVPSPDFQLMEFPSFIALKSWLKEDKTNEIPYKHYTFDCSDFAYMLVKNAVQEGYMMSTQVVFKCKGNSCGFPHMACTTKIGDWLFLIEPQTDFAYRWVQLK